MRVARAACSRSPPCMSIFRRPEALYVYFFLLCGPVCLFLAISAVVFSVIWKTHGFEAPFSPWGLFQRKSPSGRLKSEKNLKGAQSARAYGAWARHPRRATARRPCMSIFSPEIGCMSIFFARDRLYVYFTYGVRPPTGVVSLTLTCRTCASGP